MVSKHAAPMGDQHLTDSINTQLNVAAIQMVSGPNLDANLAAAARLIEKAARAGAQWVVLPENFALMGSDAMREFGEREETDTAPLQRFLSAQARDHKVWLFGGTIPRVSPSLGAHPSFNFTTLSDASPSKTYAAVHTYDDTGRLVARYDKVHLFDAGVDDGVGQYCESKTFAPGNHIGIVETPWGRAGVSVCYDLRFPEYYRALAHQGVDFFIVPSAFTYQTGTAHWSPLLRCRAIENQAFMIAANQGGYHSESRRTYGHSCIIDGWGTVLAEQLDEGEGVVCTTLNLKALRELRQKMPVLSHQRLL
ncbi:MAG TPA: carbon-nitrogen hydrolase family protein [Marinagarivorans sp.]